MCVAVTQQQSEKHINTWLSMGLARLGETRQAAVWALLFESCPVGLPPYTAQRGVTQRLEK